MRRRIFGPLLLLCVASASAQSPTVGDAPSGVAIVKFSWYNVTYRQGWDDPPDSAANHTLEDTRSFPAQDSTATQFPRPIGSPSSIECWAIVRTPSDLILTRGSETCRLRPALIAPHRPSTACKGLRAT